MGTNKIFKKILILTIIFCMLLEYVFTFKVFATDLLEQLQTNDDIEENYATYGIKEETGSRYKGWLYANKIVNNKKDITYTTIDEINVEKPEYISYIDVETEEIIVFKSEEEKILKDINYKKIEIDENEFKEILGENGYIEIYDEQGVKIGTINTETETKDGKYTFKFPSLVTGIKYRLVGIEKNGRIEVKVEKVLVKENSLSREEIQEIKSIKTENINRTVVKFEEKEEVAEEVKTEAELRLEDTKTEVEMTMNNEKLSIEEENEITYSIKLKTNSEENEVFKNPVIEMVYPYSVEDVEIKNLNLLYRNGLSLGEWVVEKDENGECIIRIKIEGEQEEYDPGTIIEGTTINLVAKVRLNRLATSGSGSIKLRYSNEDGTKVGYEEEGKEAEEYEVKYVSNSELLTVINVSNYNENNEVIEEINANRVVGKIDAESEKKVSTVDLKVVNDFKEDIEDVTIIGRLPIEGNKDGNGNDLNTTVEAYLEKGIVTTGLINKIYYSEEINAEEGDGSWKEEVEDYSKIKCFKIELENRVMHQGENIDISYNLVLPENIEYNSAVYGANIINYKMDNVFKSKNLLVGLETETRGLTIDNFSRVEDKGKYKIGTRVTKGGTELKEGDKVNERQILRYQTIVKNTSNSPITNIKLTGTAHNANIYYLNSYTIDGNGANEDEWQEDTNGTHTAEELSVQSLGPNEEVLFEYQVVVNDLANLKDIVNKTVYGEITIEADEIEKYKITTIKNNIESAEIEFRVIHQKTETDKNIKLKEGDNLYLDAYVKNLSNITLRNIEVKFDLPDIVLYHSLTRDYNRGYNVFFEFTSEGSSVTFTIDELAPGKDVTLTLYTIIGELDTNIKEEEFTVYSEAKVNNKVYKGNDYTRTVIQTITEYDVNFEGSKDNKSYVEDGEELDYTLTIHNKGVADCTDKLSCYQPYGLEILSIDLYRGNGDVENLYTKENIENNSNENDTEDSPKETLTIEKDILVAADETVKIIFKTKVNLKTAIDKQEKIVNYVSFKEVETNEIEYIIKYSETEENKEDENKENENKEDENKEPEENNNDPKPPDEPQENEVIEKPDDIANEDNNNEQNNNEDNNKPDNQSDLPEEPGEQEQKNDDDKENNNNENNVEDDKNDTNKDDDKENESSNKDNEAKENENENKNNEAKENDSTNKDNETKQADNTNKDTKNSEEKSETKTDKSNQTTSSTSNSAGTNTAKETNTLVIKTNENNTTQNTTSSNSSNNNSNNSATIEKKNNTYSISGTVWVDINKDGNVSENEEKISNSIVDLYKANENKVYKRTHTDDNGNYVFSNLSEGNYIVVFSYDNSSYTIETEYSNEQGANNRSDLISIKKINGINYGATDIIKLSDSNIENVNMRLKENGGFDLEINTYVSNITTKTSKETKKYSFKEGELAKAEIASKYIDGSEVIVTLKTRVKNNGSIEGYANLISNETIGGWDFNPNLNKNWQIGEDGLLYYTGFENTAIKPGEYVETDLILSKKMDGNSTGVFKNIAKINGISNKYEIEDSKASNNEKSVEFMISIKTGTVKYALIISVFLITLATISLSVFNLERQKELVIISIKNFIEKNRW